MIVVAVDDQVRVVALDLLGKSTVNTEVPWSWSDQYDIKLTSAGIRFGYDILIVRGEPGEGVFAVLYLAQGQLVALDCINKPADFDQEADKIAGLVLGEYPTALEKDQITVSIIYGFDIGIASFSRPKIVLHSPKEWQDRLHSQRPTTNNR